MHSFEADSRRETWLAPALARDLGRVTAPDELWYRVQGARAKRSPRKMPLWAWASGMAATAVIVSLGWTLAEAPVRLRSSKASEIRAWVKARTDLDLPIPPNPSSSIRLEGASLIGNTVEIAYRVRGREATLTATNAPRSPVSGHHFIRRDSRSGARVTSWTMGGCLYTVACANPRESQDECLLCHTEALITN